MDMPTKQQSVEYLICTLGNDRSSNLAEHLDEVSHDVITDDLSSVTPHVAYGNGWKGCFRRVRKPLCGETIACKTSAIRGAKRILFDSGNTSAENLKRVPRLGLFTP